MTIKEFRQSQGLSQPKLAKALGIGVSTVGGYETGKINPSQKVLDKIKEVYGVDLSAPEAAPAKKAAKPAKEEKPAKAAPAKKAAKPVKEEKPAKPAAPRKPVRSRTKKDTDIIIQSPLGGEITLTDILAKVGDVDRVYVRVDQNAAYWVKGEASGAVNLW
ncbi:MAG: helix-turn-helix transcriptional regulator [Clostridia bacterium]|nr:helix-turn-helix transcriptional regulator [Clostridia bacterium]